MVFKSDGSSYISHSATQNHPFLFNAHLSCQLVTQNVFNNFELAKNLEKCKISGVTKYKSNLSVCIRFVNKRPHYSASTDRLIVGSFGLSLPWIKCLSRSVLVKANTGVHIENTSHFQLSCIHQCVVAPNQYEHVTVYSEDFIMFPMNKTKSLWKQNMF